MDKPLRQGPLSRVSQGICCCGYEYWTGIGYEVNKARDHDDVIKWRHFPRYWSFVRGIHLSPVNSPHKGQRRGALMFSLICVWINGWVNNREAGDLRRHRAYYDVIVMQSTFFLKIAPIKHNNIQLVWYKREHMLLWYLIIYVIHPVLLNNARGCAPRVIE